MRMPTLHSLGDLIRSAVSRLRPGQEPEAVQRADFTGEALVRASTARDADRSIEAVVASDRPLPGLSRSYERVLQALVLREDKLPEHGPLIDSHYQWSTDSARGSVREFRIEKEGEDRLLVCRVYFADTEDGKRAFSMYRDGHLRELSISAMATKTVLRIQPGNELAVNGRTYRSEQGGMPIDVFEEWKLREVSLVVNGADDLAKVRRADFLDKERDMDFEKWAVTRGYDLAKADEAQRAKWHKEYLAEAEKAQRAEIEKKVREDLSRAANAQAPAAGADVDALVQRGVEAAVVKLEQARIERRQKAAEVLKDFPDLARQAADEGWSEAKMWEENAKATRKALDSGVGSPAIIMRGGETNAQLLSDALLLRGGMEDAVVKKGDAESAKRAELADKYRKINLRDVCRMALALDGKQCPIDPEEATRLAFSTVSLPQILGAVVNKAVGKGYALQAPTWRSWCNTSSHTDFKATTKVRLTDLGDLEEVGPAGEVKDGKLSEEYEQATLVRYAKKLTFSEVTVLNDDLGLLTKTPQRFGAKAAQLVSKLVYTHLLANGNMTDSVALFHATHSNLVTGAGYKLSAGAAALRKALETFRKQKDADNQPIDVMPRVILCAPEDEEYARALIASIKLAEGTTAGVATANIWGNMGLQVEVENRLSNSNYTGYSTTAWFLMGDKNMVDTVDVGFLNGREQPTVQFFDQSQIGIDTIGIGWRVVMDAVAKAIDWRGMVKMAGA